MNNEQIDLKESSINHSEIDGLKTDEIAKVNPKLKGKALKALQEDIEQNGQLHPVVVYNNYIIDGRNRVDAIKAINKDRDDANKLDLRVINVNSSKEDAIKLAESFNDKRRHISKSQFAMMAAYKIANSRVDSNNNKLPKTQWLPIEEVEEIKNGKVSKKMVNNALLIIGNQKDSKLASKVFDGTMSISDALKVVYGKSESEDSEKKDKIADELKEQYSEEVAKKYKSYIEDKKQYTRQTLAKRVVELEQQLEAKQ